MDFSFISAFFYDVMDLLFIRSKGFWQLSVNESN